MPIHRSVRGVALLSLAALAGCASAPRQVAVVSTPVPVAAPAPMPQPPEGTHAGMAVPPRLADGSYATPNRNLTQAATVWHLRVALNVAALGCRGPQGDAITAGYNAMLGDRKTALAAAHTRLIAEAGGQAGYDEAMTKLYNFFAQPGATAAFCAAAADVVQTLAGAGSLDTAAAPALAALDAPFQHFYGDYDRYRVALADWQAGRLQRALQPVDETPQVAIATAAPAPVGAPPATATRAPHLTVDPSIFTMP